MHRGQPFVTLDYPTSAANLPRWTNPHPDLERIIAAHGPAYRRSLEGIAAYREDLARIDVDERDASEPHWANRFLSGLDGGAIYAFLRIRNPALYLEVGSGNSTKFAHRARRDGKLAAEIISIDPSPRTEIDEICDRAIRSPLESANLSLFEDVKPGDVLFFDGSHRVFMNSDATVFFLEVLPRLRAGVLVGVHDVFLPYDYPPEFADRYYSEQYLLAAHLIAGNQRLAPILASWHVSQTAELGRIAEQIWSDPAFGDLDMHGTAFWMEVREG